jgi:hypothetical protein
LKGSLRDIFISLSALKGETSHFLDLENKTPSPEVRTKTRSMLKKYRI